MPETPRNKESPPRRLEVAAAVIRRGNTLLITRRTTGNHAGLWEFPGGTVEPGESLQECLVREIREELALHVSVTRRLGKERHRTGNLDVQVSFFNATILSGTLHLTVHDAVAWPTPADLPQYRFAPADAHFIAAFTANGFQPPKTESPPS